MPGQNFLQVVSNLFFLPFFFFSLMKSK